MAPVREAPLEAHGPDNRPDCIPAGKQSGGAVPDDGLTRLNMFARNAYFRVKSLDLAAEFTRTLETEILPLLQKQEGFKGEITLSNPGNLERISMSLWEKESQAEAYTANIYPQVLKMLSNVIDGAPKIRTFENIAFNLGDAPMAEIPRSRTTWQDNAGAPSFGAGIPSSPA
jgi:hypothetical protein